MASFGRHTLVLLLCMGLLPALAASFTTPAAGPAAAAARRAHASKPGSSHHSPLFGPRAGVAGAPATRRQQQQRQALAAAAALPLALHKARGGAGAAAQKNGGGSLLQVYLDELDRRPLFTKAWSSGVICAIGDCLSQYVVRKAGVPFAVDAKRLAIFSTVGALYVGPAVHYWFGFLDALAKKPAVAKRLPKFKLAPVLFQLSLDQTFGASVLNSGFLVSLWVVQALVAGTLFPLGGESGSVASISSKLVREFWPMLMANYKLWPLANAINFSLVPLKLRVLFANVVSVFWNMYLSAASNR